MIPTLADAAAATPAPASGHAHTIYTSLADFSQVDVIDYERCVPPPSPISSILYPRPHVYDRAHAHAPPPSHFINVPDGGKPRACTSLSSTPPSHPPRRTRARACVSMHVRADGLTNWTIAC